MNGASSARNRAGEEPWRLARPSAPEPEHARSRVVRIPRAYAAHPAGPALMVVREGTTFAGAVIVEKQTMQAAGGKRMLCYQISFATSEEEGSCWLRDQASQPAAPAVDVRRATDGLPYGHVPETPVESPEGRKTWCSSCKAYHTQFG